MRALFALLAHSKRSTDLLPALHQHALETCGGTCSILFQRNPRSGILQATSGFAVENLRPDPWMPEAEEAALIAQTFERRSPTLVPEIDRQMPDLAERLRTPAALLLPLTKENERFGLLAVGFAQPPSDLNLKGEVMESADAFRMAIELFQLRHREQRQRDVRALLNEFSARLTATLNLGTGLDLFCDGVNRLLGADRTSIWIHDRRMRQLVLRASSDAAEIARDVTVSRDDPSSPAVAAMDGDRTGFVPDGDAGNTGMISVPLRGRRRALGALIVEGTRIEAGSEIETLECADELGAQLSAAVDNMQLLEDAIQSHRELENMFDSIAQLVAVSDQRGHIVHVNQAFASRLGRKRHELFGMPLIECVGPEMAVWLEGLHPATTRAGGDSAATFEVVDPVLRGSFIVTVTDLLNHDGEPVGRVLVARDLTPQARLEAEREDLRRRLMQTEKLAALGQFVAGIAHELNNPLQGVLGHLELLRATGAFPKHLRREVQTIYREADRAAKIVRNLLVFAGTREIAHRPVSIKAVLQRVLSVRAAVHHAANIEVVRHYEDQLPRVASDPLLLHQVFSNMVMNAEHAIVAGGGGGGRIEVGTHLSRDRVIVTVRDTGVGIPEDTLSRIFEPFYTTKEVGKGTGLGLAIAYGIVQEHGGHIAAANHPDGGAIFTVELPMKATAGRDR